MTTVLEKNATQAVSPAVSAMHDIPLLHIRESKTNPRRLFDETKLTELAAFVPRNKIRVMWQNALCGARTRGLWLLLLFSLADWRLRRTIGNMEI